MIGVKGYKPEEKFEFAFFPRQKNLILQGQFLWILLGLARVNLQGQVLQLSLVEDVDI